MPATRSKRLWSLETRLIGLRNHMLPKTFDPTGSYSKRQFDQARGYRLLAHAEIESCLEDLAVTTVNGAYKAWQFDRKPRKCLISLLAYHDGKLGGLPDSKTAAEDTPLRDRLDDAHKAYVQRIMMTNHGIREANVLSILLPTGILESDLDSAWLQTIDAFGAARGGTAHRAGQTVQPPDPKSEYDTVTVIVTGLRKIDERLRKLGS